MAGARAARAASPARPAAPDPLRQARPAPVHQPPGLQPGLRAGDLPGPGADGVLVRLQPAPADLVRRRGADRVGQRGGVPRDRARRGRRPRRRSTRRSTRRCPTGLDVLEVVESPGGSLADRLEASRWRIDLDVPADRAEARGGGVPRAPTTVTVQRMTKKGLREFDCRAAVVALAAGRPRATAAGSTWCCGTRSPPSDPTTCCPGWRVGRRARAGRCPAADPARPGPPRRGHRGGRRPAARSGVRDSDPVRVRYSPWSTRAAVRDDPTTFSPVPRGPARHPARTSPDRDAARQVGDSDPPTPRARRPRQVTRRAGGDAAAEGVAATRRLCVARPVLSGGRRRTARAPRAGALGVQHGRRVPGRNRHRPADAPEAAAEQAAKKAPAKKAAAKKTTAKKAAAKKAAAKKAAAKKAAAAEPAAELGRRAGPRSSSTSRPPRPPRRPRRRRPTQEGGREEGRRGRRPRPSTADPAAGGAPTLLFQAPEPTVTTTTRRRTRKTAEPAPAAEAPEAPEAPAEEPAAEEQPAGEEGRRRRRPRRRRPPRRRPTAEEDHREEDHGRGAAAKTAAEPEPAADEPAEPAEEPEAESGDRRRPARRGRRAAGRGRRCGSPPPPPRRPPPPQVRLGTATPGPTTTADRRRRGPTTPTTRRRTGPRATRPRTTGARTTAARAARRRRRRRRRRGRRRRGRRATTPRTPSPGSAAAAPPRTRSPRSRGSTRLEAKKQRRREGREAGRRRAPDRERGRVPGPPRVGRPGHGDPPARRPHPDRRARGQGPRRALRRPRVADLADRQRLPRPGAERAAVHGGGLHRHRQGPQRGPVRRRGQLVRARPQGRPAPQDRVGALLGPDRARAGHQGPDRPQGRPPDQPDQPAPAGSWSTCRTAPPAASPASCPTPSATASRRCSRRSSRTPPASSCAPRPRAPARTS